MVPLNNQFVLSSFDLCGCIEGKRTSSKLSLPQKKGKAWIYKSKIYEKIFLIFKSMESVEQMKGNKTIKAGGSTAPQMSEWTGCMDGFPLDCYDY